MKPTLTLLTALLLAPLAALHAADSPLPAELQDKAADDADAAFEPAAQATMARSLR